MTPQHWMVTDVGVVREHNEDAYLWMGPDQIEEDAWLWAVCDGMGGETAGELASATVIQSLREVFPLALRQSGNPHHALRESFEAANRRLLTMQEQNPALHKMGTTAAAMCLFRGQVWVASVGDSRIYGLHDGQLDQITRDQTKLERMLEMGIIGASEADGHPAGNVLLSALGRSSMEINTCEDRTFPPEGNVFMLCSDGLSSFVQRDHIQAALERLSARDAASTLTELARRAPSDDNITCGVVRFAELDAARATGGDAFLKWVERGESASPAPLRAEQLEAANRERDTPPITSVRFDPRERWRDHKTGARPIVPGPPRAGRTVSFSPDEVPEAAPTATARPSSITARGGLRPKPTGSLGDQRPQTARHAAARITRSSPAQGSAGAPTAYDESTGPAAPLPPSSPTLPEGVSSGGRQKAVGGFTATPGSDVPPPLGASRKSAPDASSSAGPTAGETRTRASDPARDVRARGLHISHSQAQRFRDNATRHLDDPMQSREAHKLGLAAAADAASDGEGEGDDSPEQALYARQRSSLFYVLLASTALLLVLLVLATLKFTGGGDEGGEVAATRDESPPAAERAADEPVPSEREVAEPGEEPVRAAVEPVELPAWRGPERASEPDHVWDDDGMPAYLVAGGTLLVDAHEVTVGQLRDAIQESTELRALHREVDAPRYRDAPCSSGTSTDDNDEREPACVSAESASLYCRLHGRRLPTREDWRRLTGDDQAMLAAGYGILFDTASQGPPPPVPAEVNGVFGTGDGLPEALQPSELDLARGDLALLGGSSSESLPIVVRSGLRTQLLSGALEPAAVPMVGFRCVSDDSDVVRGSGSEARARSASTGARDSAAGDDEAARIEEAPVEARREAAGSNEGQQRIRSVQPRWEQVPAPREGDADDDESSLIFERIRSHVDQE